MKKQDCDNLNKIVILDGFTTNPGDLSWDCLVKYGSLTVYDRTPADEGEIIKRAEDASILLTNKVIITNDILRKLPKLRYIGLMSTGVNVVDITECAKAGIPVTNIPGYSTTTVAQMTFSMILELLFHVSRYSESVHRGEWVNSQDFTYQLPGTELTELEGKTLGVIGTGSIGSKVAAIGEAFGMKIIKSSRRNPNNEQVFRESDIITLHCPLNGETAGLINKETIGMMKPGAFLINTARGGLVDEQSLADALNSGRIAGAGVDVLSTEPPKADNPLLTAKNCIITPHIAWASKEARGRLISIICKNIEDFLKDENDPDKKYLNVVNKELIRR